MINIDVEKMEAFFINELGDNTTGHVLQAGNIPILISAPHSVSQWREGEVKLGEYRTGVIAMAMAASTGCSIAYKTKNLKDDANFDDPCAYKTDLLKFIQQHPIQMVIDLHISMPERDYDIDIGTGRGENILMRTDLLDCMYACLSQSYSQVKIDDTFTASYPFTVSSTIGRLAGIPAFQLEINWKLIATPESTLSLINHLIALIHNLEELICTDGLSTTARCASRK